MCLAPIWIRNRAYSSRTIGLTDRKVLLKNRPWDYFTQRIMVPCGHCEECLRQQRNDWYVRLERETKYQKSLHRNSVFVTITIAPEYYDSALLNPSSLTTREKSEGRRTLSATSRRKPRAIELPKALA